MIKITSKQFTHTFFDIWKSEDRRFCFVLGAGASRSSDIRTGGELAKLWIGELKDMLEDQPKLLENFIQEHRIDINNPGLHYPEIYKERFKIDITSGIDFINKEIDNKTPSYGYSVLAQVIAEKQHNIIITTNFDNLVEEALYTYTYKRPLVCGHESLAAFAKPSLNRPLIIKIHRDRFFAPKSLPEEIDKMNRLWIDALNNIFSNSIPVFIGYGGNDGSMMGYLEKIEKLNNLFWCERRGVSISERVQNLLIKHDGKLVEIEGFDELMFALQDKLQLKLLDKEIVEIAINKAKVYQDTVGRIRTKQANSTDKDAQEAANRLIEKVEDDWWAYQLKVEAANTNEEKEEFYKEGLQKFPLSFELLSNYARFLRICNKDYERVDEYYRKALEIEPNFASTNGDYANFLVEIKKDYDSAEKYYLKSIDLDSTFATNIGNYAVFLKSIRRRYDEAKKYYLKALTLEPANANNNGNYAGFLFLINNKESLNHLNIAFENCDNEPLLVELLFYKYAYIKLDNEESLKKLKGHLCNGIRSLNFDLQDNVDDAINKGHSDPKLLQQLADIITKDIPIGNLCNEYTPLLT